MRRRASLASVLLLVLVSSSLAQAPEPQIIMAPPPSGGALPPRQVRGRAIEGMISATGDASLRAFVDEQLAPSFRASMPEDTLFARLRAIRAACRDFGGILYRRLDDGGTRIEFVAGGGRKVPVVFHLEDTPPNRITSLELGAAEASPNAQVAPITWETLASRLDEEAAKGFNGTVLVARDGKVVLHRGYGLADRATKRPNDVNTIYGIGSVPIDFTRAAVLRCVELGKLSLADSLPRFLTDVPADKRGITIEQLMTGRSGLPNFHESRGVDADPDLAWIDRETAIRRMMERPLVFAPGTDRAHSHSAWVLLAAIVEIVTKQSYADFLRTQFFGPAGMTRTGQHEETQRFADDAFAVGYGQTASTPNIPKHWGRTSWLVMGSGGMVSTPGDLNRWLEAMHAGRLLSAESQKRFWTHGVLAGGDMHGYSCVYTEGPGNWFIICSNDPPIQGRSDGIARALSALVGVQRPPVGD